MLHIIKSMVAVSIQRWVSNMSKPGLYANIHAKRARGEKMRDKGDKGAPSEQDFIDSAKTAKKNMGHGGNVCSNRKKMMYGGGTKLYTTENKRYGGGVPNPRMPDPID